MFLASMGPWQMSLIFGVALLVILIPLIAIVDILRKPARTNDKLLWVLIVLASNFFGSLLYFLKGREKLKGS